MGAGNVETTETIKQNTQLCLPIPNNQVSANFDVAIAGFSACRWHDQQRSSRRAFKLDVRIGLAQVIELILR